MTQEQLDKLLEAGSVRLLDAVGAMARALGGKDALKRATLPDDEGSAAPVGSRAVSVRSPRRPKGPNKTEQRFADECLRGRDARFEGLTLRMANGHRYTPDWVVVAYRGNGNITCYEVKGSYRLHSHQRARLAFDQARCEWPCFRWLWAELQPDGTWRIE